MERTIKISRPNVKLRESSSSQDEPLTQIFNKGGEKQRNKWSGGGGSGKLSYIYGGG